MSESRNTVSTGAQSVEDWPAQKWARELPDGKGRAKKYVKPPLPVAAAEEVKTTPEAQEVQSPAKIETTPDAPPDPPETALEAPRQQDD